MMKLRNINALIASMVRSSNIKFREVTAACRERDLDYVIHPELRQSAGIILLVAVVGFPGRCFSLHLQLDCLTGRLCLSASCPSGPTHPRDAPSPPYLPVRAHIQLHLISKLVISHPRLRHQDTSSPSQLPMKT